MPFVPVASRDPVVVASATDVEAIEATWQGEWKLRWQSCNLHLFIGSKFTCRFRIDVSCSSVWCCYGSICWYFFSFVSTKDFLGVWEGVGEGYWVVSVCFPRSDRFGSCVVSMCDSIDSDCELWTLRVFLMPFWKDSIATHWATFGVDANWWSFATFVNVHFCATHWRR